MIHARVVQARNLKNAAEDKTNINFMEVHGEITPKEAETITGKSAATVGDILKCSQVQDILWQRVVPTI